MSLCGSEVARPAGFASVPRTLAPVGELGEADFQYLRDLVHRKTGIYLADGKRAFAAGRLARRVRELGLRSYAQYCAHLRAAGESEHVALFDSLCIHETRFFREPAHFDYLSTVLIPRWRTAWAKSPRRQPLRLWSAGCSTGEEAYSLGMLLRSLFPAAGELGVEVLATDISTAALSVAQKGMYRLTRASELADGFLKLFMLRGQGRWTGWMRVDPEIRSIVRFERLNLHDTPYALDHPFDAIFCRNVLIYFDAPTRARVVRALLAQLKAGGALFIGHAEGLHGTAVRAQAIHPSVYTAVREEDPAP
jgi:chemotaxis protein methyltransferase CheR